MRKERKFPSKGKQKQRQRYDNMHGQCQKNTRKWRKEMNNTEQRNVGLPEATGSY
jgi:hypothetical protein